MYPISKTKAYFCLDTEFKNLTQSITNKVKNEFVVIIKIILPKKIQNIA